MEEKCSYEMSVNFNREIAQEAGPVQSEIPRSVFLFAAAEPGQETTT
jgi:hypothetical protein